MNSNELFSLRDLNRVLVNLGSLHVFFDFLGSSSNEFSHSPFEEDDCLVKAVYGFMSGSSVAEFIRPH